MKPERIDAAMLSRGTRNVLRGLLLLCIVLCVGTVGYMLIESWEFLDALYMTVITITTVGYGEIRKVDGYGRIFTIILIFFGMGIMAYTVGMVAQAMVELQLRPFLGRRKLELQLKSIKDHYIVCGYGRIGKIVARELQAKGKPLLVIESDAEAKQDLEHDGFPYLIGDATNEDVLMEAGIERAKGVVSVVSSDADNLFITMTVRGLRPDVFILVRTDTEATRKKLVRAGATRVVMPYLIGGRKMAQTITRPAVTEFLEFTVHDKNIELEMEELIVHEDSKLNGVNLMDSNIRQQMNVIIVAIRKKDGKMTFNPSSHTQIEAGDTLIALGHTSELARLEAILGGP